MFSQQLNINHTWNILVENGAKTPNNVKKLLPAEILDITKNTKYRLEALINKALCHIKYISTCESNQLHTQSISDNLNAIEQHPFALHWRFAFCAPALYFQGFRVASQNCCHRELNDSEMKYLCTHS
jgi:hypothetical protein